MMAPKITESDLAARREPDILRLAGSPQGDGGLRLHGAFRRFGVSASPAVRLVEEPGLSENVVTLAKSRVVKRLREDARDFLK